MSYKEKKILAETKAIKVIKSCNKFVHFAVARTYINLFHDKFNDMEAYNRLHQYWHKMVSIFKNK